MRKANLAYLGKALIHIATQSFDSAALLGIPEVGGRDCLEFMQVVIGHRLCHNRSNA